MYGLLVEKLIAISCIIMFFYNLFKNNQNVLNIELEAA